MRYLLFAIGVLAMLGFVHGAVIVETAFSELGYEDFRLEGADKYGCADFAFSGGSDTNWEEYAAVSLHAEFLPVGEGVAVEVYLNDMNKAVRELHGGDFTGGWARLTLPGELLAEENSLRVCCRSSYTTTRINLLKDSKVGYYLMPDFSRPGAFTKTISVEKPKVAESFSVIIKLRNYGSEAADVELLYRRATLEDKLPRLMFLHGKTSMKGTVPACIERDANTNCILPGEIGFEYAAKAEVAERMTLLPAIVLYATIFGESVEQESNRQTINVVQPEIKIKAFLLAEKELLGLGEADGMSLAVKNEGSDTLYNIMVGLETAQGLEVNGMPQQRISVINPGETKYLDFSVTSGKQGMYGAGCKITYLDYNVRETACDPINVRYEGFSIDPVLIYGAVLLAVGLGVYVYFVSRK